MFARIFSSEDTNKTSVVQRFPLTCLAVYNINLITSNYNITLLYNSIALYRNTYAISV